MKTSSNWVYKHTDKSGYRVYKLWNADNKRLTILHLRHYKDDLNDHVNWELWEAAGGYTDEDQAASTLQYKDGGIYGTGFIECLNNAIEKPVTYSPMYPEDEYELMHDRLEREEELSNIEWDAHWAQVDAEKRL